MERGLPCRTSLWGQKPVLWFCSVLFYMAGAKGVMSHDHSLSLSSPHLYYTCPEGSNVKLACTQKGAPAFHTDVLKRSWLYTPFREQHCPGRMGPRHMVNGGHPHGNHTIPPGVHFGSSEHEFWVFLQNLTHADQGRYCCMVLDIQVAHQHTIVQKPHSHIILEITPRKNGSQDCTVRDSTSPGSSVPVAVAVAACILALLSLPLILVLVYKQRETGQSSRRAQELVRMDSDTLGHENPVFLGESPKIKTRTVSQIMTRQSSETGRHLLSEPGTPLSPPAHGDVFFPIEDTIAESPELVQV